MPFILALASVYPNAFHISISISVSLWIMPFISISISVLYAKRTIWYQHVQGPTHSHGHTPDSVITKGLNVSTTIKDLSDRVLWCVCVCVWLSLIWSFLCVLWCACVPTHSEQIYDCRKESHKSSRECSLWAGTVKDLQSTVRLRRWIAESFLILNDSYYGRHCCCESEANRRRHGNQIQTP